MTRPVDFRPSASLVDLRYRADIVAALRSFFLEQGFWEVETPILSSDVIADTFIDPIAVPRAALEDLGSRLPVELFLQTSPEFAMKRLLAAGADRIFQICKAFRAGERGSQHNPEFTILEWYHADDYPEGLKLLAKLTERLWPVQPCRVVTYCQLFEQHFGLDPLDVAPQQLHRVVLDRLSVDVARVQGWDRDDCLTSLLAEIQTQLGHEAPMIVCDWPVSQAALARAKPTEPRLAERFELYVQGMELANGYCELTDPDELLRRMQEANRKRVASGRRAVPVESRLLAAMRAGLPSSCGVALGVDRLVMVLLNKSSIDQVIPFPIESA
ncbi:MAG TPA: EF-P lysine aminoacylase EpmA [Pirellulaceae bacterium]|nr:EF-P lysine aminoacylase EpmA [Pirellulaceae bacterium]